MRVYNLEIFRIGQIGGIVMEGYSIYYDVYHRQINEINYAYDYFKSDKNIIEIPYDERVQEQMCLRISDSLNASFELTGYITGIEVEKGMMKVTYTDLVSAFTDINVAFNVEKQNAPVTTDDSYLEYYLGMKVEQVYNEQGWFVGDLMRNLDITPTTREVNPFNFNIKPDNEGSKLAVIGFKDVLINRSASEYDVWFRTHFETSPYISIGKVNSEVQYLETNAPFVISSIVKFENNKEGTSVLSVYNADETDENMFLTFYLHEDGTINQNHDETVVKPLIYAETVIKLNEGEVFSDKALEEAKSKMNVEHGNNYVEIEVPFDTMDLAMWEIGQKVKIYHEGMEINSVLTGKKIDKTLTLIFGTIRLELTKRLERKVV